MVLKKINSDAGDLIAIIIPKDFGNEGINFISEENFPMQVGISIYNKGNKIKAHYHQKRKIEIERIQEIIYLQKGRVKVDLFDLNNEKFESAELDEGDTIFFVDGGHGFEILEDTKIIEAKQGPYLGRDVDKKEIK
jgi:hypothetical protein